MMFYVIFFVLGLYFIYLLCDALVILINRHDAKVQAKIEAEAAKAVSKRAAIEKRESAKSEKGAG